MKALKILNGVGLGKKNSRGQVGTLFLQFVKQLEFLTSVLNNFSTNKYQKKTN